MSQLTHDTAVLERQRETPTRDLLAGFSLLLATHQHAAAIDALRQRAYANAGYLSLPDPRTVRCETDPEGSICLLVARQREIAATVRVSFAPTRARAEAILEGTAKVSADYFPTVTLCRGATDPNYRGLGLMAFLVAMGVRIAWYAKLGSALGVQYDGTPHYRAMNAAGWDKKPIAGLQMATVQGHAPLSLVYIGHERFDSSVAHSARVHRQLFDRFDVDGLVDSSFWAIHKQRMTTHNASASWSQPRYSPY